MKKLHLALLVALALNSIAASRYAAPLPDPWSGQINDTVWGPAIISPSGAGRDQTINPAQKTLVLIVAGQSNWENITPTLYTPSNFTSVDAFSIYDSGSYAISGPMPGTQLGGNAGQGPGNIAARVADTFVTNGVFNRVVIASVSISSTTASDWASSVLYNRVCVAISRLAARGMTPSTPGVTFAFFWGQGESDTDVGTTKTSYMNSWNSMLVSLQACGLTGFRSFIAEESWSAGVTSASVEGAQTSLVNGTTIFSGGNLDALGSGDRIPGNTHFNDTGAAAAASIVYSAMHASGAPF